MQGRFQRAGAGNVTIEAEVGGMQPHVKEVLEPPETQETRAGCSCKFPEGAGSPPGLGLLASRPVGEEIPVIFSFSPVGGNLSQRLQKPGAPALGWLLTLLCGRRWGHSYIVYSLTAFHILGAVLAFRCQVIRKTGLCPYRSDKGKLR